MKTTERIFMKILPQRCKFVSLSVDKEELMKFWKSSAFGSRSRNLCRNLQNCEMGHFSTIRLISLEKPIGSPWKMYHRRIPAQGSHVTFGKSSLRCKVRNGRFELLYIRCVFIMFDPLANIRICLAGCSLYIVGDTNRRI